MTRPPAGVPATVPAGGLSCFVFPDLVFPDPGEARRRLEAGRDRELGAAPPRRAVRPRPAIGHLVGLLFEGTTKPRLFWSARRASMWASRDATSVPAGSQCPAGDLVQGWSGDLLPWSSTVHSHRSRQYAQLARSSDTGYATASSPPSPASIRFRASPLGMSRIRGGLLRAQLRSWPSGRFGPDTM